MKHVNADGKQDTQGDHEMMSLDEQMLKKTEEIKAATVPAQDTEIDDSTLAEQVIDALREIYDPEIPVNIYDLGLIYKVQIEQGMVEVDMTLTTPGCPVAHSFPGLVEASVKKLTGVKGAEVSLVWDPPWTQDNLSEEARLQLGLI